jgi:hypothetical protein
MAKTRAFADSSEEQYAKGKNSHITITITKTKRVCNINI